MVMIKQIAAAALLFLSAHTSAKDYTVTINWAPNEGEAVDGYRVYEYIDGQKFMRYEGQDTVYEQNQSEPTVFGVVAYNQYGESEVVPRVVLIPQERPQSLQFRVIVSEITTE